ncbi:MAG: DUF6159 family protein [Asgard group archaeon]|nr:DUF6159 family protein [Asgard group archaeon]
MSHAHGGKIELKPANRKAITIYVILSVIFLGFGILSMVLLFTNPTYGPDVKDFFSTILSAIVVGTVSLANYWWVILLIVLGLIVSGFLVGWLLLYLVSKLGHILVYAGCILTIVGGIIGGLVALIFFPGVGLMYALTAFIPAGIMIFIFAFNFQKIKRAGTFMKFTGQVILAEKRMIVAPLIVSIVSVISGLNMIAIFAEITLVFQNSSVPYLGYILGSLATLLQLIVYYGIFYAAEAVNTTYAYEWYRKRDPDMPFCLKNVRGNFGGIFAFGVATAVVSWVQQLLRNAASRSSREGNIVGIILAILARILASIMGFIYKYLTYFTLPAIVVEGREFKDGVKRSFDLIKRYYMDVLVREIGVERAIGIVQWISFFIYGVAGTVVGLILYAATSLSLAGSLLITIIPALIFAFVPTFFINRPMKTSYLTFIFAYAQDEETNFRLPTRMPEELRGDLKEASKTLNPSKSIAKMSYVE